MEDFVSYGEPTFGEKVYGPTTEGEGLGYNEETGQPMQTSQQADEMLNFEHDAAAITTETSDQFLDEGNNEERILTEEELMQDATWIADSKLLMDFYGDTPVMYDSSLGTAGNKADQRYAHGGLQIQSELIGNMGGVSMTQQRAGGVLPLMEKLINEGSPEQINAMLRSIERYEDKPMTVAGWQRGFTAMLGDASNYMGIGLLANAGKRIGGKVVSNEVKNRLTKALATRMTAIVGTTEGAAYTFVDNMERQRLEIAGGGRGEVDLTELGIATGIGGLAGYGLVTVPPAALKKTGDFVKWVQQKAKEGGVAAGAAGALASQKDAEATFVSRPGAIADSDYKNVGFSGKRGFISDKNVKFATKGSRRKDGAFRLGDVMEHPTLFKHYPELEEIGLIGEDLPEGTRGYYSPSKKRIVYNKNYPNSFTKETIIHELQHATQQLDGVASGSNSKEGRRLLNSFLKKENVSTRSLNRTMAEESVDIETLEYWIYRANAGEVEAFASAADFTGEAAGRSALTEKKLRNDSKDYAMKALDILNKAKNKRGR